MQKVTDQDLAVGGVYAGSMLRLAEEQGQAEALAEELRELVRTLDREPEIERFFASPVVDEQARSRLLEKAFRGRASDLLVDSLQVMGRKGRLGLVRAVAEAYRRALRDLRGHVDVTVRTTAPLDDASRSRLKQALTHLTGKQPDLAERLDPSLIGGLVVEVEGTKIDASVARRLRELASRLDQRSSQEIFRGRALVAE